MKYNSKIICNETIVDNIIDSDSISDVEDENINIFFTRVIGAIHTNDQNIFNDEDDEDDEKDDDDIDDDMDDDMDDDIDDDNDDDNDDHDENVNNRDNNNTINDIYYNDANMTSRMTSPSVSITNENDSPTTMNDTDILDMINDSIMDDESIIDSDTDFYS